MLLATHWLIFIERICVGMKNSKVHSWRMSHMPPSPWAEDTRSYYGQGFIFLSCLFFLFQRETWMGGELKCALALILLRKVKFRQVLKLNCKLWCLLQYIPILKEYISNPDWVHTPVCRNSVTGCFRFCQDFQTGWEISVLFKKHLHKIWPLVYVTKPNSSPAIVWSKNAPWAFL